ncbi:uncharacterized protein LOC115756125 [Rhodamnia argentea]|uniref:Uncharacterized protein LOC115756125 n=1 Tax=Rhodamnia argentea TaxID=178133 RepID=A0A8B8QX72_9MYRT|nr:uncharacterized protein LOC115756125 [Rhodamnia argentea]
MELSCGDDTNTEERRVSLTGGTQDRGEGRNCMEVHHPHHEVELEIEFWPLEHPTEPPDEDQPVKCPMLSTSAIPGARTKEEQIAQSMRKRADAQDLAKTEKVMVASEPSIRPLRKRHHNLTHGDIIITPLRTMPPPPLPPPPPSHNMTIFHMLQQQFDSLEN